MKTEQSSTVNSISSQTGRSDERILVEVAYALPDKQTVIPVSVPAGSRIDAVIEASGILQQFPEIDLDKQAVGIFSQLKKRDDIVQADDRVEIYRDLIADPKEVRRRRAAEQKKQGIVR